MALTGRDEALARGFLALLTELGRDPDGALEDEVRRGLATMDLPEGDVDPRDLNASEILRIRLAKMASRLLPAARLQDPPARLRLREGIRALAAQAVGDAPPSRFLDVPRR